MEYHLIFHQGVASNGTRHELSFRTEAEAVILACTLIAQGRSHTFHVESDTGAIVTTNAQIMARCKGIGL
jgi:hypothetical protein